MSLSDGRPTPDAATADDLAEIRGLLGALMERLSSYAARWMPIETAADYCGLSAVSVRRLLAAGRLTAYRPIKGRVLVDRRELDSLILASTARPRSGRGRRRVAV